MPVSDLLQGTQQRLENGPATELVYDQFVLDKRTVRQPGHRFFVAQPAFREKAAGQGAVTQHLQSPLRAQGGQRVLRAPVQQGILHLHADQRHPCVQHGGSARGIEIGAADIRNQAFTAQGRQFQRCLHHAGHGVVPPVELHQIQTLHAQALQ